MADRNVRPTIGCVGAGLRPARDFRGRRARQAAPLRCAGPWIAPAPGETPGLLFSGWRSCLTGDLSAI